MAQTAFKTNPISLEELLKDSGNGKIQLPDFQRSWVWDEDRIKSLISSISEAFPIGALMTLEMKAGAADTFARRPIEGASTDANRQKPDQLLLDGQQRMTSLYQTCMRKQVVETITPRQKLVKRWFYIDIQKALKPDVDREDAIFTVAEDRKIKEDFDRRIVLDLSTPEAEYEHLIFPVNQVFDWDAWQDGFGDYWIGKGDVDKRQVFQRFKNAILQHFKYFCFACRLNLLCQLPKRHLEDADDDDQQDELAEQRLADLKAVFEDMRQDRDHWRVHAGRLALADARAQRAWWRRLAG